jgi:hypothetical protein
MAVISPRVTAPRPLRAVLLGGDPAYRRSMQLDPDGAQHHPAALDAAAVARLRALFADVPAGRPAPASAPSPASPR